MPPPTTCSSRSSRAIWYVVAAISVVSICLRLAGSIGVFDESSMLDTSLISTVEKVIPLAKNINNSSVVVYDDNNDTHTESNVTSKTTHKPQPVKAVSAQSKAELGKLYLSKLKVPTPILVASLPKSGTTSVWQYFTCGHIWTAHTFIKTLNGGPAAVARNSYSNTTNKSSKKSTMMRIGECYVTNVQLGRPPFENCGRYKVFSDNGYITNKHCYYPSVHGLDYFYKHYSNTSKAATILLVKRNATSWTESVRHWKQSSLLRKWKVCNNINSNSNNKLTFPTMSSSDADMHNFYNQHAKHVADFAARHPSLTYIELQLEDEDIANKLEQHFGIEASCWGKYNVNKKANHKMT